MISIMVAVARGGVIGGGNAMPWHISEDLQRFKRITSGHPVVMGRKTFESLGRALPLRRNVVISRQKDYSAPGCEVAGSLALALALFPSDEEVFVIGGAEIYRQALPLADRLYITWIEADFEGDTHFPGLDMSQWEEISRERHERGEKFPHPFTFADYRRA